MPDPDPEKDDQLEKELKRAVQEPAKAKPVADAGKSDKTKAARARKSGRANGKK